MILIWIAVGIFLLFAFVVVRGAPFLISHSQAIDKGIDLLDLESGQTLLDLGSGNGAVLVAGAKRGLNVIGYELNPILVVWSRLRLRKYGKKAKVFWGDYWTSNWPKADGIYIFLLPRYTNKLDQTIKKNLSTKAKVVSYSAEIPNRKPIKKDYGLYLYQY